MQAESLERQLAQIENQWAVHERIFEEHEEGIHADTQLSENLLELYEEISENAQRLIHRMAMRRRALATPKVFKISRIKPRRV